MKKNIIVIAEHFDGQLRPVTYELIAFARELQEINSDPIKVLIIGDKVENHAQNISRTTGMDVTIIQTPGHDSYNGEIYKSALKNILPEFNPSYICVGHTSQGQDFAPALAVRLQAACITGVNEISVRENSICFTRSVFNGKINVALRPETDTAVLTIQPGTFKIEESEETAPGNIEIKTFSEQPTKIQNIEIKTSSVDRSRLTEAATIVAAGRGIGKKENIELMQRLAELFHNSAVAGSRPLVDMGWMEHSRQVGLTGATVSPDLYIACGVSGSSQHIAGMKNSKFIVAINSDPNAAIFNAADVCIVEDVLSFVETLIQAAQD